MRNILLAFISFALFGQAFAGELRSIEECRTDLFKSNSKERVYVIEGSRKTGLGANRLVNRIRQNNGRVTEHKDLLGVKRYEVFTLRNILEREGQIDSCRGLITATELKVCTSVSNNSTCETRCELNWVGPDCR